MSSPTLPLAFPSMCSLSADVQLAALDRAQHEEATAAAVAAAQAEEAECG